MFSFGVFISFICVFISYVDSQTCTAPFRFRGRGGIGLAGSSREITIEPFNKQSEDQVWKRCEPDAEGSIEIIHQKTGNCLDSIDCGEDEKLITYACHGGVNQRWSIDACGYISAKCNKKLFVGINSENKPVLVEKPEAKRFKLKAASTPQ